MHIIEIGGALPDTQRHEMIRQISLLDARLFPANPWEEASFLQSALRDYDYLAAAVGEDGSVCGYALLRCLDDAELLRIAVAKEQRRRGTGRALLADVLGEAGRRAAAGIFLEVRAGNEAAVRMYEKAGFVSAGIRRSYYSGPVEDALIMRYSW